MGQFLGKKAVLEEVSLVPRENVVGASGLESAAPTGPHPQPHVSRGSTGTAKGAVHQHSLGLHSLHMCN